LADYDIILARCIKKTLDANDFSLGRLTLILSLHCLVKCRSRTLAIYNNEVVLGSACISSEMINSIATNTAGNYCFSKSRMCHIASSLLQHVLKMSSFGVNANDRRWHRSPTARSV